MIINSDRPIEELAGSNRGIVRQRLGNIHCMRPIREQLKHARPRSFAGIPASLRRGWVLCVLETIRENRSTYVSVMSAVSDYQAPLIRRD